MRVFGTKIIKTTKKLEASEFGFQIEKSNNRPLI